MTARSNPTSQPVERLTRREAQAIAVIAQGLASPSLRRRPRLDDLRSLVERLGCVQLDTISVVSRSHETVAFSRLGPYDPKLWEALYEPEHAITEFWAHAAAIIPMDDLHLYRPTMERARDRLRTEYAEQQPVRDAVLARIRAEGPLASRHFDAAEESPASEAWDWYGRKPEREALADLWSAGDLVLRRRENFQRVFDVAERLVPDLWERDMRQEERDLTLARKAMRALGVTTLPWFVDYFRTGGRPHLPRPLATDVLACLVGHGDVVPVTVEGIDAPAWLDAGSLETLDGLRKRRGWPNRTTFLSPFDNLAWNRRRTSELWRFDYRLEIYVPAAKRIYGYYSMPILHRGDFVGRLDPSFNRKSKLLTIKSLHWEPRVRPHDPMLRAVSGAIGDMCVFLGGERDRWVVTGQPAATLPAVSVSERDAVQGLT
jgi:uncharacterized protein YcaQ